MSNVRSLFRPFSLKDLVLFFLLFFKWRWLFLGILSIAPQAYYETIFEVLYVLTTIALGSILFVMIKSAIRKEDGALYFLTGFIILFICGINDMLVQKDIIDNRMYISLGLYFVIYSQAFYLSLKFTKSFYKVEKL